jgi:hypothetical protein
LGICDADSLSAQRRSIRACDSTLVWTRKQVP